MFRQVNGDGRNFYTLRFHSLMLDTLRPAKAEQAQQPREPNPSVTELMVRLGAVVGRVGTLCLPKGGCSSQKEQQR